MSNVTSHSKVEIFIDAQKFELEDRQYTPRELLELAEEDPAETTLAIKKGNQLEKLTDPATPIDIKNGEHFVVLHNGPTPVS